jgi:hypothetical protein
MRGRSSSLQQVDGELLAVALLEEEAGHKLRPRNS